MDRSNVPLLEARNFSVKFAGSYALRAFDVSIWPGEVRGLLGQNGSGKSTFVKALAGFHPVEPEAELRVAGCSLGFPLRPADVSRYVSFVHQDLALISDLTVAENFAVGELSIDRRPRINWRRLEENAESALRRYGLSLSPRATVAALTPVDRALLAITRAVSSFSDHGKMSKLLVLDEPTAYLGAEGIARLRSYLAELAGQGHGVLLISHSIPEVRALTSSLTVLRDGQKIEEGRTADFADDDIVKLIAGRTVRRVTKNESAVSDVRNLLLEVHMKLPAEADVRVSAGEVIGVTGLRGGGWERFLYQVFGAEASVGWATAEGSRWNLANASPGDSIRRGVAFVPGDRGTEALIADLAISDNVMMLDVLHSPRSWRLPLRKIIRDAAEAIRAFQVRPGDPSRVANTFSGGNQQRAVLAKWLKGGPRVVLLHEPTQGVDVGAREEIYEALLSFVQEGGAAVVASNDYEQLARLCDRVYVFSQSRLVNELAGADVSEENILKSVSSISEYDPTTTSGDVNYGVL